MIEHYIGKGVQYRDLSYIGHPDYIVTENGEVWSNKWNNRWHKLKAGSNVGYLGVVLCTGGHTENHLIHRLVLEAFRGSCPEGMETRHLNGIRMDNRLSNLCWGTKKEQEEDKERHGTIMKGQKNGESIIPDVEIPNVHVLYEAGKTLGEVARIYSVSSHSIRRIILGISYRHCQPEKKAEMRIGGHYDRVTKGIKKNFK